MRNSLVFRSSFILFLVQSCPTVLADQISPIPEYTNTLKTAVEP